MEEQAISLRDIIDIVIRRKWTIMIPTVSVFLVAVLLAATLPRTYRSTSTIMIEAQEIPKEYVTSSVTTYADQRLQVLNQRIMSTTKLLEILNRFNLYAEDKANRSVDDIIASMRKDIKFNTISADVVDPRTGRPGQATIAFSVSYEGKNPNVVQQVANVLASLYLEENLKERRDQSLETSKFMEIEVKSVQSRLQQVESQIAAYKQRNVNALPELSQVNLQSFDMADREAAQLKDQLRTLNERKSSLEHEISSIPTETSSQASENLKALRVHLVDLQARYTNEYPDVIKTKAAIRDLEKQIKAGKGSTKETPDSPVYISLSSQLAGIKSEIDSVQRRLGEVASKKEDYRRRIEASPRVEEGFKNLIVERNTLQQKFDDLNRKAMDAKVAHGLEQGQLGERFSIIDAARLPEKPVRPKVPAILLIGLILGLGSGVGAAALRESNDQSIRSVDELMRLTGLPVLSVIPDIVTDHDRQQRTKQRQMAIVGGGLLVLVGLVVFHFTIMDLGVLVTKILRRFS